MTLKSQGTILIVADDTAFPPSLIESLRRAQFETVVWSASFTPAELKNPLSTVRQGSLFYFTLPETTWD